VRVLFTGKQVEEMQKNGYHEQFNKNSDERSPVG